MPDTTTGGRPAAVTAQSFEPFWLGVHLDKGLGYFYQRDTIRALIQLKQLHPRSYFHVQADEEWFLPDQIRLIADGRSGDLPYALDLDGVHVWPLTDIRYISIRVRPGGAP